MSIDLIELADPDGASEQSERIFEGPHRFMLIAPSLEQVLRTKMVFLEQMQQEGFEVHVLAHEDAMPDGLSQKGIWFKRTPKVTWDRPISSMGAYIIMHGHMLEHHARVVHVSGQPLVWLGAHAARRALADAVVTTVEDHSVLMPDARESMRWHASGTEWFRALVGRVFGKACAASYRMLGRISDVYVVHTQRDVEVALLHHITSSKKMHLMPGGDGVETQAFACLEAKGAARLKLGVDQVWSIVCGVVMEDAPAQQWRDLYDLIELTPKEVGWLIKAPGVDPLSWQRWSPGVERVRLVRSFDGVRTWYAAIDVLVSLRRTPGVDPSWLEAYAASCPVWAYATTAARSVVEDGLSGGLVTVGDVDLMARCVCVLTRDREALERMGKHGLDKVKRRFERIRSAKQLVALCSEALQEVLLSS